MADSIVFGAAGFIGSALVARLLDEGRTVIAAVRPGSESRVRIRHPDLTVVAADITKPDLGPIDSLAVQDVYNCAARFAFGLDAADARAVNVDGAVHVLEWAARLPALRRLVHVSGYRVSVPGHRPDYRAGAYEASKTEGDRALWQRAAELNVPVTVANPSTVLGPGQYIGLAEMVRDLWQGKLPAIPGGRRTLVPIVELGYFAEFLARIPEYPETAGAAYTVLDPDSPALPDLIRFLAAHLDVPAPRFTVPLGVLRRLPAALTGVDRERLAFLSEDRYDTSTAQAFAARAGLVMPPTETVLREWADHLMDSGFGEEGTRMSSVVTKSRSS
ncbi:NAD-dependent epimerase/dehydratase family protein [Nocardia sp. NPDC057227]|uniref:NAD-dependent epimerase/dehydratase family protein n=1 Tax=Nocardia sp. NPDC057227 TaxID=3346056 RepID=UPI00362E649D